MSPPPLPSVRKFVARDPQVPPPADSPLSEFDSEADVAARQAREATVRRWVLPAAGIAACAALAIVAFIGLPGSSPAAGGLRIESDPAGAEVRVDGEVKGRTPLALSVAAGAHTVLVTDGSRRRELSVSVTDGQQTVYHISLPAAAGAAPATGALQVVSDPRGAAVSVDGVDRGVTPLVIGQLTPGDHEVVVRTSAGVQRRTVTVASGATASLVLSGTAPAVTSGWIAVNSTLPVQIFEDGRLIGTSEIDRVMLPSGSHTLELAADALGFRTRRTVTITPAQTTSISVNVPQAPLSINAVPWAEVWIDGRRVGETPMANVMLPIGAREVTFRHPQLGEKRVNVAVTLNDPARVSVDMRAR